MGVFGEEESWADSGESSTTSMGLGGRKVCPDADRLDAPDLAAFRGPRSLPTVSSSAGWAYGALNADFTKVAWLDDLDFMDIFDLSSVLEVGLETVDKRERGLSSGFPRSELVPVFLSSKLVSGGLGGRSLFCEAALLTDPKSTDLDRLISSAPMSVASGVGGPVPVRRSVAEVEETSSLLPEPTASLLCALLKLG